VGFFKRLLAKPLVCSKDWMLWWWWWWALLLLFQPSYYLLHKTHVIYIYIYSLLFRYCFYFFFLGAERLWSPLSITQQGSSDNVLQRLQSFRCLLDQRGIAAAPLLSLSGAYAFGRVAPSEPGSCFRQWNKQEQNPHPCMAPQKVVSKQIKITTNNHQ
jgi:hypothetical protein